MLRNLSTSAVYGQDIALEPHALLIEEDGMT
jgi:hypothetical protein